MDRRQGTHKPKNVDKEDRKSKRNRSDRSRSNSAVSSLGSNHRKVVNKDNRRKFRALKVDILTTFESVENLATIVESEIDDLVTMSWSVVTPKVKSINRNPKGKSGKDGKGNDSKGKKGKGEKGKGK